VKVKLYEIFVGVKFFLGKRNYWIKMFRLCLWFGV